MSLNHIVAQSVEHIGLSTTITPLLSQLRTSIPQTHKKMVSRVFTFTAQPSFLCFSDSPKLNYPPKISLKQTRPVFLRGHGSLFLGQANRAPSLRQRNSSPVCFFNAGDKPKDGLEEKEVAFSSLIHWLWFWVLMVLWFKSWDFCIRRILVWQ